MLSLSYWIDPVTKADVQVYTTNTAGGGIARKIIGANWEYLNNILKWQYDLYCFKDYDEAIEHWNKYVASVEIQKEKTVVNNAITPLLIDKKRKRIKYKCPSCNGIHIARLILGINNWDSAPDEIFRFCPRENIKTFIKLGNPTAKLGDIPFLPKYDCKECWTSGEFVLFTSITQCKCCIE